MSKSIACPMPKAMTRAVTWLYGRLRSKDGEDVGPPALVKGSNTMINHS